MRYCYKCKTCGARREVGSYGVELDCFNCADEGIDSKMVRDYRAEAVGLSIENLRAARG